LIIKDFYKIQTVTYICNGQLHTSINSRYNRIMLFIIIIIVIIIPIWRALLCFRMIYSFKPRIKMTRKKNSGSFFIAIHPDIDHFSNDTFSHVSQVYTYHWRKQFICLFSWINNIGRRMIYELPNTAVQTEAIIVDSLM